MNENLTKAADCADFVRSDLLGALSKASAVEAIVLTDLIRRAAELNRDILALQNAIKS